MIKVFSFPEPSALTKEQVNNLKEIVEMKYTNICFSSHDYYQIMNIPFFRKNFYGIPTYKHSKVSRQKLGWFNNGATSLWLDYSLAHGLIRVSLGDPDSSTDGWFPDFSILEENCASKINRIINMKAFL